MQHLISWRQKITAWLFNFLLVQLFINLITWPLFLGWGLPITPLSIIGNLVFSPFLTAFLMISSLMVTCDLLCLPSTMFAVLLDYLTAGWLWFTSCPTPDYLITFVTPPLALALCAPFGATYIIRTKKFSTPAHKVYALLGLYIFLITVFSMLPRKDRCEIPYGSHSITVLQKNKKLFLIDPGFTRRKNAITTWINYTLLPALGTNFGQQTVDYVILKKNSPSAQACAQALRERSIAKKIVTFPDGRARTTPSSHAAPSASSKNPSCHNLPALPHRGSPRASQR